MIFRRLAGLALIAPLLHLNVARAEVACGSHGRADSVSAADDAESHAPVHHGHPQAEDTSNRDANDPPAQRDCCQAVASCSLSLGCADDARDFQAAASPGLTAFGSLDEPASRVAAPEPPPPRA